ncbi:MAG: choice-of-anchor J domain-containing protein [Fimbriimonadales bacterium]
MSKLMNRILIAAAIVVATSSAFAQLTEGFDDIGNLPGWNVVNLSTPVGLQLNWFNGNPIVFPSHSGAPESYIAGNFNFIAGAGTINAWVMTPEITFQDGAMWSFWTRSPDLFSGFPDRLHFKMSTSGASTDPAAFTTTLVTINPGLGQGYPTSWTQYQGVISGVGGSVQGRLGFHYDVPNAGPTGANGDYIGIDTFSYTPVPEPGTIAVLALGLGALIARRRKA